MIRTEIVLCCDSCKKRLENYDSASAISSKDYNYSDYNDISSITTFI